MPLPESEVSVIWELKSLPFAVRQHGLEHGFQRGLVSFLSPSCVREVGTLEVSGWSALSAKTFFCTLRQERQQQAPTLLQHR